MIVPAILSDKKDEFENMLNICESFIDYVQIDIMDGIFVPSKSVTISDIEDLKPKIKTEAHLMVKNPISWLEAFKNFGTSRIIFHFEIGNHNEIIQEIKKNSFEVGLAINPDTPIDDFLFLVDSVDSILFMSVNPGFYGSKFIPEVLDKVRNFKKLYPNKLVGIDGGIKLDNVEHIKKSGVDYICVGSAILKNSNPKIMYENFLKILNIL